MSLTSIARRLQGFDRLLPIRFRLPARFRIQSLLGALEPEVDFLPELLHGCRGKVALDIGANVGIYTYALARLGMRVHAFEPQPSCCAVIAAWARDNTAIVVHNSGVGAAPGELVLNIPLVRGVPVPTRASFQRSDQCQVQLQVPVVSLDTIGITDVSFIKIDVEGFELQVLQGAAGLLRRMQPVLLVEIDRTLHDRESFDEILRLLSGLGYRSHIYAQGTLIDCSSDPWKAPDSHYNFIFLAHSGVNA